MTNGEESDERRHPNWSFSASPIASLYLSVSPSHLIPSCPGALALRPCLICAFGGFRHPAIPLPPPIHLGKGSPRAAPVKPSTGNSPPPPLPPGPVQSNPDVRARGAFDRQRQLRTGTGCAKEILSTPSAAPLAFQNQLSPMLFARSTHHLKHTAQVRLCPLGPAAMH